MSDALINICEGYSDLLIQTLSLENPGELLARVLASIDQTQQDIEKGLLR